MRFWKKMPGRPRTPTNILKLRGADRQHPARMKARENEPVNTKPIGNPPAWLSTKEKQAWKIITTKAIDGVLGEADWLAVGLASKIVARCIAGTNSVQDETIALRYLGQFGMTPSERSKITLPKKTKANRFED